MSILRAGALLASLLLSSGGVLFAQTDSSKVEITPAAVSDSLNKLVNFCDSTWEADDTNRVVRLSQNGSYPVRAFATVLLFRIDTAKYIDQFTELFAIHDYKARASDEHNMSSQAKMLEEFQEIQASHPTIIDNRLRGLLMFAHVRDANLWVDIRDQRVSMSRFFRSAFLADIFKGYGIDVVKVQIEMDSRTEAADMNK